MALLRRPAPTQTALAAEWLKKFHAGDREVMDACYREHFATVERRVGSVLKGCDKETVVYEVFYRLVSDESMRQHFHGGSLAAWLGTVARNEAIDYARRYGREWGLGEESDPQRMAAAGNAGMLDRFEAQAEARLLVEQFRREVLPAKWEGVFRTRFLEQLDQREAAARLGMHRTTLAYQELRIRRLLRRFVLRGEGS